MMRSVRKPPLPTRSPIHLRSRRTLHSSPSALRTPPGALANSTQVHKRAWESQETELRPEYHTISCEIKALAKMVQHEFGNTDPANVDSPNVNVTRSPLFERGRFYDEYSARRNERLKRKKGGGGESTGYVKKKPAYDLGVRVEPAKKRETKKFESVRKSVCSTPATERREIAPPRYMLRSSSSKENKKAPTLGMDCEKTVDCRITVRRVRKNY